MHIQDFFQNFLKLFLVGLHGNCTISLIAQDMSPGGRAGSEVFLVDFLVHQRKMEFLANL